VNTQSRTSVDDDDDDDDDDDGVDESSSQKPLEQPGLFGMSDVCCIVLIAMLQSSLLLEVTFR